MLETSAKYSGFAAAGKDVTAVGKDVAAARKDVAAAEKDVVAAERDAMAARKKRKENVKRMESGCAGVTENRFYGQK